MKRILLVVSLLLILSVSAFAQTTAIPPMMNFQGRLSKPDGTPVPDGNYQIAFSIFSTAIGGTALWTQTMNPVLVRNGAFAVLLGNGNPLNAEMLNGTPFLEIRVGNDTPLSRQQFASIAFAFKANTVPDGAITTAKIADSAVTNAKILSVDWSKVLNVPSSILSLPYFGSTDTSIPAFQVANTSGNGIYSSSNSRHGFEGVSNTGNGVYGRTNLGTGVEGASDTGRGVFGRSNSNSGVDGSSNTGRGVFGHSNTNSGVDGSSDTGRGVFGHSNSGSGVQGLSDAGTGIYASSNAGYAGEFYGPVIVGNRHGARMVGIGDGSLPGTIFGPADSGRGIVYTYGSSGQVLNSLEYIVSNGQATDRAAITIGNGSNLRAGFLIDNFGQGQMFADVKTFRIPSLQAPGMDVVYGCVEGPEVAAYIRGTAQLINGQAIITLPPHFLEVSSGKGITVQLTPLSTDSMGLAVVRKSLQQGVEVRELHHGAGNYSFDYEVKAVRRGQDNHQVYQPRLMRINGGGVTTIDQVPWLLLPH